MNSPGKYTLEEILSQAGAWEQAYEVVDRQHEALGALGRGDPDRQFFFTGCGSTYYLALAAAAHLRSIAHRRAQGVPASELWLDGDSVLACR